MMKLFAVRDVKGDSFSAPLCCPTRGIALRGFSDACATPGSDFNKYPEDYQLYEIGEYEPNSATIKALALPSLVATASDVCQQLVHARQSPSSIVKEVSTNV